LFQAAQGAHAKRWKQFYWQLMHAPLTDNEQQFSCSYFLRKSAAIIIIGLQTPKPSPTNKKRMHKQPGERIEEDELACISRSDGEN
jgi:hypothetical protein